DYFLKKYSVQYNKPPIDVSPETMRLLVDYDWPGNIRELENLIKRAVVLGTEAPIRKEIVHGVAMAAQRLLATDLRRSPPGTTAPAHGRVPANGSRSASAGETGAASSTHSAPLTPREIAAAAAESGNYSLKEASRTAAREAERELILRMLQQT